MIKPNLARWRAFLLPLSFLFYTLTFHYYYSPLLFYKKIKKGESLHLTQHCHLLSPNLKQKNILIASSFNFGERWRAIIGACSKSVLQEAIRRPTCSPPNLLSYYWLGQSGQNTLHHFTGQSSFNTTLCIIGTPWQTFGKTGWSKKCFVQVISNERISWMN